MKKSLPILFLALLLSGAGFAKYSGGTGEPNDPYLIATPEDLNAIGDDPNDWDKQFLMTADINMSDYTYATAVIAPATSPSYPFKGVPFTGTFDGNCHTIFSFTIDTNSAENFFLGLFGKLGQSANLINLEIADVNITGYRYIGGLCADNEGNIDNCSATGTFIGYMNIGGLCANNGGGGDINNCYTKGFVSGDSEVGGLCAYNEECPGSEGNINNCFSEVSVTGDYITGGLCGYNRGGNISNCYATGSVGGDFPAGFCGYNSYGIISNCYSAGPVNGNEKSSGFCGNNYGGTISNSFWDVETSGTGISSGGIGKTTIEMQTKSTFTDAGWDFNTPIWEMCPDTNDYPHLWWEYYCNSAPVAIAGPNQVAYAWIDSFADVTLDGSASYDDDNDVLDYYWSWTIDTNDYEANGVSPVIQLPVGEHQIELIVDDGWVLSEPDYCTVNVIEPLSARLYCHPRVLNVKSHGQFITAFINMPEGVTADDINDAEPLLFIPGNIEATRQFVRQLRSRHYRRTYIMAAFDRADCMENLSPGRNEVNVVGQLNTGQYFYGTDNLRVIDKHPWVRRR